MTENVVSPSLFSAHTKYPLAIFYHFTTSTSREKHLILDTRSSRGNQKTIALCILFGTEFLGRPFAFIFTTGSLFCFHYLSFAPRRNSGEGTDE
jgi:hypothetical protein